MMMYNDLRMAGYSHHQSQMSLQQQQQQSQMSLWDISNSGWKMEPVSPPSPPPIPHSPFVDLDADSWFQDGGTGDYNSTLAAASANVHNQQNTHYSACSSPDLIVPDTGATQSGRHMVIDELEVEEELEDSKPPTTRAEAAQKLLNDLDEWIKEEPFSDWYEEKIDLPIFEELETVQQPAVVAALGVGVGVGPVVTRRSDVPAAILCQQAAAAGPQFKMAAHHQPPIPVALIGAPPPTLMQEFDFVLNNHQQQQQQQQPNDEMLTPPESPPSEEVQVEVEGLTLLQNMPTEELDELVRIRVESLVEGEDSSQCSSYSQEAEEECSSSLSSSEEGASSPAPSQDSGYEDRADPDWTRSTTKSASGATKRRRQSGSSGAAGRPPPEEKRQRKKEQNKNAATRYRLKKKAEIEEILGEERQLLDTNHQLKADLGELQREIKYLKSLMREVFKAKGLIK